MRIVEEYSDSLQTDLIEIKLAKYIGDFAIRLFLMMEYSFV
jgi:hypothetical protein